ncbi:alpha-glucan family phosphorylase [Calycomorphotria hydatis]|uniref:Carbohydrate phosphorylase n=1 Tax=Calycomorphotria hydatis TaxID=2528027 RepID=A0A517TBS2_9PLAN|nr:alpha-glucan family phosphorylase [Calycomorphotria hydatis]QDT65827.1 Carbohydrate phosphorylase [Calycomorphotria hydatis]
MPNQLTAYDKLSEMAQNLWWSWQPEMGQIFRSIDPHIWRETDHNPILLLKEYPREKLEDRCRELMIHSSINRFYRKWKEYLASDETWGDTNATLLGNQPVAYFSAEFGLHESLPIYSGGLGVLAGDHLKSASDLGVPLVAVGLFYDEGYFTQSVDEKGWQQEHYTALKTEDLPIRPALDKEGQAVKISVDTRNGKIHAAVWRVDVGRVPLFLLDTDVEENAEEDRNLTSRLYSGGTRTRIRQEIMLGIGGLRALTALGIRPSVIHMNEGHSAFAPLEMIHLRMEQDGMSFGDAMRDTARMGTFTTHTPVDAGHDRFDAGLVEEHVGPLADQIGLDTKGLLGLGRIDPQNDGEPFCMTVLAFKLSRRANAVSNLHGVVSRRMWQGLWPWRAEEELPIGHITNGVHVGSWLSSQMRTLYDRVLPQDWYERSAQPEVWAAFEDVPPTELWETHQLLKGRLIGFCRSRLKRQAKRYGLSEAEIDKANSVLDPDALTIGFARRFAPYKRADLVMRDFERFKEIITSADRPVQMIYAGKAHPRDDMGKAVMQNIINLTRDSDLAGKIVFIENYDINVCRHMIQGVDVWLNNPRRPLEASGTSGQKVVLNGGLNCSVLDGWWAEGYDRKNGFAIGEGRTHTNSDIQDQRDAVSLMEVLMNEVIPLYYDRDDDDLPQNWIKMMKRAIRTLGWRFNADRMVADYVMSGYVPAAGGVSCQMPPCA